MAQVTSIPRPKRWDVPFCRDLPSCQDMTEEKVKWLLSLAPFSEIDEGGFRKSLPLREILKNDARIRECQTGDILVRQGDWGNSAFFVLEGIARVDLGVGDQTISKSLPGQVERKKRGVLKAIAQLWKNHAEPEYRDHTQLTQHDGSENKEERRIILQDIPVVLDQHRTARIEPGQWFGELAALGRTARTATIFAENSAKVLEIRWQGLRDIMRFDKDGRLKQYLEDTFREHALAAFLRNEPLFRGLSDSQMAQLIAEVRFETYGEYDSPKPFKKLAAGKATKDEGQNEFVEESLVATQGDTPGGVFLIRSGIARLVKQEHHGHRTAGYLMPGHTFGLEEITESIESNTEIPLRYSLSAIGYMNVVVVPISLVREFQLGKKITPVLPNRIRAGNKKKQPDEPLLNFLVDHSFVQGSSTMVIDLNRCTRCDDCVRACAKTHDNNPRFIRQGPIFGDYMFANACLHCADPVCMIECPTGAIQRDLQEGLIVISEETCIGCAQCANNCPFDAIRMVQIRDAKGDFILDGTKSKPLMQATKCDLCIDQNQGPACQNACPHDALVRIDMQQQDSLEGTLTS